MTNNYEGKPLIQSYFRIREEIINAFNEFPVFKEMWVKDITNEFLNEYKQDEFIQLYKTELDIVTKMANRAANNFFDKLIDVKFKNELTHHK